MTPTGLPSVSTGVYGPPVFWGFLLQPLCSVSVAKRMHAFHLLSFARAGMAQYHFARIHGAAGMLWDCPRPHCSVLSSSEVYGQRELRVSRLYATLSSCSGRKVRPGSYKPRHVTLHCDQLRYNSISAWSDADWHIYVVRF